MIERLCYPKIRWRTTPAGPATCQATTKVNIPTAATNLIPVPTRNDRNDPTPTTSACPIRFAVVQQFAHDSPYERPYHDTDQAAHDRPAIMPTVAPTIPARVPPNSLAMYPGRK